MLAESPNRTAAISIASANGVPAVRGRHRHRRGLRPDQAAGG